MPRIWGLEIALSKRPDKYPFINELPTGNLFRLLVGYMSRYLLLNCNNNLTFAMQACIFCYLKINQFELRFVRY